MKIKIEAILDFNADLMYGDDEDAKQWFFDILRGQNLVLHENAEIADDIGTIQIVKIEELV